MAIRSRLIGAAVAPLTAQGLIGTIAGKLAATGSSQSDALLVVDEINVFTTVNSGTGARVRADLGYGDEQEFVNYGANALSVYPPAGGTVQNGALNAAFSVPPNTAARLRSLDGLNFAVVATSGTNIFNSGLVVPAGRVGVGTNAPVVPVDVSGGSANLSATDDPTYRTSLRLAENYAGPYFGLNITNNAVTGGNVISGIEFSANNGSNISTFGWVGVTANSFNVGPYPDATFLEGFGSGGVRILSDDPVNGLIAFYTGGYTSDTYRRMTIEANGNVGIATLNPDNLLAIGGGSTYPPTMTSNTTPAPYVASASTIFSTTYDAWKAFDSDPNSYWNTSIGNTSGWLKLDFGSTTSIGSYLIQSIATEVGGNYAPKTWTLEGSATGAFAGEQTVVDTQTNAPAWGNSEVRTYTLSSPASYRYFRLNVSANEGNANYLVLATVSFTGASNFSVNASGSVNTSAGYKVNGTQVVGPRQTGFGTPTGGADQGNWAAGSITLANLAAQVALIQNALRTHGLLGT